MLGFLTKHGNWHRTQIFRVEIDEKWIHCPFEDETVILKADQKIKFNYVFGWIWRIFCVRTNRIRIVKINWQYLKLLKRAIDETYPDYANRQQTKTSHMNMFAIMYEKKALWIGNCNYSPDYTFSILNEKDIKGDCLKLIFFTSLVCVFMQYT